MDRPDDGLDGLRKTLAEAQEKLKEMTKETERSLFWEQTATEYRKEADYYREQLVNAHALLGRVIHQISERWDTVNLTKYFPTDNLYRLRRVGNAEGKKESTNG